MKTKSDSGQIIWSGK